MNADDLTCELIGLQSERHDIRSAERAWATRLLFESDAVLCPARLHRLSEMCRAAIPVGADRQRLGVIQPASRGLP